MVASLSDTYLPSGLGSGLESGLGPGSGDVWGCDGGRSRGTGGLADPGQTVPALTTDMYVFKPYND